MKSLFLRAPISSWYSDSLLKRELIGRSRFKGPREQEPSLPQAASSHEGIHKSASRLSRRPRRTAHRQGYCEEESAVSSRASRETTSEFIVLRLSKQSTGISRHTQKQQKRNESSTKFQYPTILNTRIAIARQSSVCLWTEIPLRLKVNDIERK